eukprot:9472773-Pyramimonas_sp.AAC.2
MIPLPLSRKPRPNAISRAPENPRPCARSPEPHAIRRKPQDVNPYPHAPSRNPKPYALIPNP